MVEYLDGYLGVVDHPDYPNAVNGLQLDAARSFPTRDERRDIERIAVSVDVSSETIARADEERADLLIVHHGLFWDGLKPIAGAFARRVRGLLDAEISLYSCHLPLDAHVEVGNCILLAKGLGIDPQGRFGTYDGRAIGWWGLLPEPVSPDELALSLERTVGSAPKRVGDEAGWVRRVGVVTGSGSAFLGEAAALGLEVLVTGEAGHHDALEARELGIHLLLGGHYATETFGVRALGAHVEERFGIPWIFIDAPTGF